MLKTWWKLALLALCLSAAAPGAAEWREARTDHFILKIDDSEEGAREFATKLERFDSALRRLYDVPDTPERRLRPLEIYAFKPDLFMEVTKRSGILGYYRPEVGHSFIFSAHLPGMDKKAKAGWWSSQNVLLHEYSHYFAYSSFPIAYPYWFSEGFAEFNGTATFEPDGSIIVGRPANNRAEGLRSGNRLPPKELFEPERYGVTDVDLIYGRGWLLTHYLMLDRQRRPQLAAYLTGINKGKSGLEAAREAFGDLNQLNRALDAYMRGTLLPPLRIAPEPEAPKVTVRTLSRGEAAMVPIQAALMNGVDKWNRLGYAIDAGKIARRYPDDPEVLAEWADAELSAERFDVADKAADAALALQPHHVDALLTKGVAALMRAKKAKATDPAVWAAARSWLVKANRADPNAVLPLFLYYQSFLVAKAKPTPDAVKGLMRAEALAPDSGDVRLVLARQMLIDGEVPAARTLLQPVAYAPHTVGKENLPRKVLELIDAGKIADAKAAIDKLVLPKDD